MRLLLVLLAGPLLLASQDSEKLQAYKDRIAVADKKFVKALEGLAKTFQKRKFPEAAHFFAECAVGFGSTDPDLKGLRSAIELEFYLGKDRGGKILKSAATVTSKLKEVAEEYEDVTLSLLSLWELKDLGDRGEEVLRGVIPKHELSTKAFEYVKVIQEVNALREKLGLRAVLWEFWPSVTLMPNQVLLGTTRAEEEEHWEEYIKQADPKTTRKGFHPLKVAIEKDRKYFDVTYEVYASFEEFLTKVRSLGDHREPLLNPNGRRIWIAAGKKFKADDKDHVVAWNIPSRIYRKDIPTPSASYQSGKAPNGWVETEHTLKVGDLRFPYVYYPFDGESDVPRKFGLGNPVEDHYYGEGGPNLRESGIPVILHFVGKIELTDVETGLKEKDGEKVETHVFHGKTTGISYVGDDPAVMLLPKNSLKPRTYYVATVICKVNGNPFQKTWSFRTAK